MSNIEKYIQISVQRIQSFFEQLVPTAPALVRAGLDEGRTMVRTRVVGLESSEGWLDTGKTLSESRSMLVIEDRRLGELVRAEPVLAQGVKLFEDEVERLTRMSTIDERALAKAREQADISRAALSRHSEEILSRRSRIAHIRQGMTKLSLADANQRMASLMSRMEDGLKSAEYAEVGRMEVERATRDPVEDAFLQLETGAQKRLR